MNYKKTLLLSALSALLFFQNSCQQSQQTDYNTYGRKVTTDTLITTDTIISAEMAATANPQSPSRPDTESRDTSIAEESDTTASQILLGNPSRATNSTVNAENYLIDHKYYVESYSRSRSGPNWVSWHIGIEDLGSTKRLNNFRPDTDLPQGWYEVNNSSYKGSGFDKGHNCPSGDRSSSTAANSSTFLMNNIIPQAPNHNQHTWEHLESYCRAQVKRGNEVYVIMGSYGRGGTGKKGYFESIDNGRITVPSHIWKVVVVIPEGDNDLQRINGRSRVIAIDTPNDNNIEANWMKYLCTVRDIEKATGYNLLSALPKAIQDRIELEKFKGGN
jgi:endonuclease G